MCVSRSWQRRQQQECHLCVEEDEDTLVVGGLRFEVASSRESLQRRSLQAGDRVHHDNVWLMVTIAAPVRACLQGQMTGRGLSGSFWGDSWHDFERLVKMLRSVSPCDKREVFEDTYSSPVGVKCFKIMTRFVWVEMVEKLFHLECHVCVNVIELFLLACCWGPLTLRERALDKMVTYWH